MNARGHTTRRIASTCYAVPVGGTPHPGPRSGLGGGIPSSKVRTGGTPIQSWQMVLWGTPYQEGWGIPHQPDGGTPPPKVEQTHTCENITSRHPSDAGGKNPDNESLTYHIQECRRRGMWITGIVSMMASFAFRLTRYITSLVYPRKQRRCIL